jgi:SAM-dependent methyltransferase
MDRNYWEKIAPAYNEEIFDVLQHDESKVIVSAIKKLASKKKTVIDMGCAVGKWLPILSPLFKKVVAVDISAKNLAIAKATFPDLKNVTFKRADMSHPRLPMKAVELVICINAILTGDGKKRTIFFRTLSKCVKKNGHLILVVPSLESSMYTSIIRDKWKIDREIQEKISLRTAMQKWNHLQQGNVFIDGVATKHYVKEELILLLSREGFVMDTIKKVEYNWRTEFHKPPRWLKAPYPWDWMVVAKKIKP